MIPQFKSFAAYLRGEIEASGDYLPPPDANLPRRGVLPVRRAGGSLKPGQIAWCDENILGFRESRLASERVAKLYEESKPAGHRTTVIVA